MNEINIPKVCVIGGGIAGLSSAVFLADKGIDVTLFEAAPKLGGRAYSFFDKTLNEYIDNGQHILATWYNHTFELLKIIGSGENVKVQEQLRTIFADRYGNNYEFKCPDLIPPLHLIWGIFNYKAISLGDKFGIVTLIRAIKNKRYSEEKLKAINSAELFQLTKQGRNLIDCFWKPFINAVFNAEPEETNAWYFAEMIKLGFLSKGNSKLVLPLKGLNELYVNKSVEFLEKKNACIKTGVRVIELRRNNSSIESLLTEDNNELKFDYYISAVPFFDFRNLIGDELYSKEYNNLENLKSSPIVNVHLKYNSENDRNIFKDDFIGILNSTIQWVFRVNSSQICIVISSAKKAAEMGKDELIKLCIDELKQCLPEFKDVTFTYSKVIKEMRATFLPDKNSLQSRPGNRTRFTNFFIAGDWTDTGCPATIESAVMSAKNCVKEILNMIN